MKKIFLLSLFLIMYSIEPLAIEPVYSTVLVKDTVSWDGGKFHYPGGTAQIIVQKITISPGDEAFFLSEHCHPVPLAAYVLKGSVHIFSAGHAFIEGVNTWHKGKFLEDTELIAFYAASEGTPLSVNTTDSSGSANKCK